MKCSILSIAQKIVNDIGVIDQPEGVSIREIDVRPDDVRIELAVLNSGNIKEYLNRIDKVRGELGGGLWRISFIGASGCDQPTVEVVAIVRSNDTGISRLIPVIDREAYPVEDRR